MVNLIGYIFDVIIIISMSLCFFALSANMSANLFEQTKEIAVLRAIGMTNIRIRLLYFYEAFLLVVASSAFGLAIGSIVG